MNKICSIVIILSAVVFSANAAAGAIYKWSDERGNVHFSDRPQDGRPSQRIELQGDSAAQKTPVPEPGAQAENQPEPASQPDADKQREVRVKNCAIAQQTLDHNQGIGRMYRQGPDGERVFLSDEEREQVLQRSREDVQAWCD